MKKKRHTKWLNDEECLPSKFVKIEKIEFLKK